MRSVTELSYFTENCHGIVIFYYPELKLYNSGCVNAMQTLRSEKNIPVGNNAFNSRFYFFS